MQVVARRLSGWVGAVCTAYWPSTPRPAKAAGVPFQGHVAKADSPYAGILAAAKQKRCDLIFMASHGRRGLAGFIMGSVTQKVLTQSRIPVLVYR